MKYYYLKDEQYFAFVNYGLQGFKKVQLYTENEYLAFLPNIQKKFNPCNDPCTYEISPDIEYATKDYTNINDAYDDMMNIFALSIY